jgi:hypothetical protein
MGMECTTNEVRKGMHIGYCWKNQKERIHKENLEVSERIKLRKIIER